MLAIFIVALFFWLSTVGASTASVFGGIATQYELRSKEVDMVKIGEAMELYYQEKGTMPPDLATLAATPGYEYIAARLNNWEAYSNTGQLTDGTWSFTRTAAVAFDHSDGTTVASYFAANACGTNGFATEIASWCGAANSRWYAVDTRKYIKPQMTTERVKLDRLSQKFADYYNTNGAYPSVDQANNPLGAASITSLAQLAGYSGSARNCSGQFQYQGIPIDCDEMFDLWGGLVGYQFQTSGHVILVSEPPIFDASGNRVIVAVDRD
jgi:hypothetical protein